MTTRSQRLYATPEDWRQLLPDLAGQASFQLVDSSFFEEPPPVVTGLERLAGLGTATSPSHPVNVGYLIVAGGGPVVPRLVPQKLGPDLLSFDMTANHHGVILRVGGLWVPAKAVIAGLLATGSDHPDSQALFAAFAKPMRKAWKSIKGYCVGPHALDLHRSGWRLTDDANSPPLFDLSVETTG
jgi:hypothetical protein